MLRDGGAGIPPSPHSFFRPGPGTGPFFMKLDERFDISESKTADLKARIARLGLDLAQVEESFITGGGKGGQKINRTSNCVVLRYAPLGLAVRCQRNRRRNVNRFLALRELVDQAEMRLDPAGSRRLREIDRMRRRKARRRRKSWRSSCIMHATKKTGPSSRVAIGRPSLESTTDHWTIDGHKPSQHSRQYLSNNPCRRRGVRRLQTTCFLPMK